jgi:hypothetical protein
MPKIKSFAQVKNFLPEQKMNKDLLLIAPTSCRTCIKPPVSRRPARTEASL